MSYTIEVSPRLLYTLADGVSDEVYSPKAVHTISNYLGESSPNNVVVLTADNCIDPSSFTLFEEEFKSVVDLSFVEKEENF
jgi:hypothetical protein